MQISVIVRTLGRRRLAEALKSLSRQTCPSVETVLTDMSGGAVAPLLRDFRDRLPNLLHLDLGRPLGRSQALNHAIARASGVSRSFTGRPGNPNTTARWKDCVRCRVGIHWSHRDLTRAGEASTCPV